MGFGAVMTYTKCSDHLVNALFRPLTHVPAIVGAGAAIITWVLNIVLPSAAGVSAAVGVLLIPALIALKVRPVDGSCRRVPRHLGFRDQPRG